MVDKKSEIEYCYSLLKEALKDQDTDRLKVIISDDYQGFGIYGNIETKQEILDCFSPGGVVIEEDITENVEYEIYDKIGIVSGKGIIKGKFNEFNFCHKVVFTDIFRFENNQWKYFKSHITEIKEEEIGMDYSVSGEKITSKTGKEFIFRELQNDDNIRLGLFFESLSNETRLKYAPHPLNQEFAEKLCCHLDKNTIRFVVLDTDEIVGYFIIDFNYNEHDSHRYKNYGISIDPKLDPLFAPCIADKYQNQGISSQAMNYIFDYCRKIKIRSLILMGGTQESNITAVNFYKKSGFQECGVFFTEYNTLNNIDMIYIF